MTRSNAWCSGWWRKGDLDGFFGLLIDNLIQLILIVVLCGAILDMPDEMLLGRILPGVAISLLLGNLFYAWQARRLNRMSGRSDATALPYGINTISLFAYILFVMKPVLDSTQDVELAWQVGLAACLGSGLIELAGALFAERIKRITPRAALLATLAGIAMTFIAMDFMFRIYADPLVGLIPLAIIFMQYIGRLRLPAGIPSGLVAIVIGTLLAWLLGRMDVTMLHEAATLQLRLPELFVVELFGAAFSSYMIIFLPVIFSMGLFNLLGSLQNLESAEAAGDRYPVKSALAINGLGTIAGACFGSVFPTTIYIGHPGWKQMGAGAGYSVANGVVITLLCLLGLVGFISALIPVEAGAAILLWIGMTMAAQAFTSTPGKHAIAVVAGFFPAIAAWGCLMIESGLRAAGTNIESVGLAALAGQLPIAGMIALERGFIITSTLLAAMTVCLVECRYRAASLWALVAAGFSATGLIHGYIIEQGAIVSAYGISAAWPYTLSYLGMAAVFMLLPPITKLNINHRHPPEHTTAADH
jgi:AGZA family xanthine/uracil permease-like MFS transporter